MKNIFLATALSLATVVFVACNSSDSKKKNNTSAKSNNVPTVVSEKLNAATKEVNLQVERDKLQEQLDELQADRKAIATELMQLADNQDEAQNNAQKAKAWARYKELTQQQANLGDKKDIDMAEAILEDYKAQISELVNEMNFLDLKVKRKKMEIEVIDSKISILDKEQFIAEKIPANNSASNEVRDEIDKLKGVISDLEHKLTIDRDIEKPEDI